MKDDQMKENSLSGEDVKTPKPLPTPQPSTVKLEEELEEIRKRMGAAFDYSMLQAVKDLLRVLDIVDELKRQLSVTQSTAEQFQKISARAHERLATAQEEDAKLREVLQESINRPLYKDDDMVVLAALVAGEIRRKDEALRDAEKAIDEYRRNLARVVSTRAALNDWKEGGE